MKQLTTKLGGVAVVGKRKIKTPCKELHMKQTLDRLQNIVRYKSAMRQAVSFCYGSGKRVFKCICKQIKTLWRREVFKFFFFLYLVSIHLHCRPFRIPKQGATRRNKKNNSKPTNLVHWRSQKERRKNTSSKAMYRYNRTPLMASCNKLKHKKEEFMSSLFFYFFSRLPREKIKSPKKLIRYLLRFRRCAQQGLRPHQQNTKQQISPF